ncbi:MAG: peptidoglycan-binding domain-containing protein, partial [Patescibacteria group bacterium]
SDDVKRLQELLASDSEIYPEGIISGWFGQLTRKAVMAFQKKYGIEQVGIVGPQTRAKLNEIFGKQETAPTSDVKQQQIETLKNQIQQLQETLAQLLQELTNMLQEQIKGLE